MYLSVVCCRPGRSIVRHVVANSRLILEKDASIFLIFRMDYGLS